MRIKPNILTPAPGDFIHRVSRMTAAEMAAHGIRGNPGHAGWYAEYQAERDAMTQAERDEEDAFIARAMREGFNA
jgi:hypothetical protein